MFSKTKFYIIISLSFALFLPPAGISFAIDDGFGAAKKIEGKHFTVYYAPGVDISSLAQQLNVGFSDKLLVGLPPSKESFSDEGFVDMLDVLFMRVSDILDMHLYSYKGNIKICATDRQLEDLYNNLFRSEAPVKTRSFYIFDLNTIYVSADNFKREIIGHEMGHAAISNYFVVQQSVRIQEILAGYVEYQLRKSAK